MCIAHAIITILPPSKTIQHKSFNFFHKWPFLMVSSYSFDPWAEGYGFDSLYIKTLEVQKYTHLSKNVTFYPETLLQNLFTRNTVEFHKCRLSTNCPLNIVTL